MNRHQPWKYMYIHSVCMHMPCAPSRFVLFAAVRHSIYSLFLLLLLYGRVSYMCSWFEETMCVAKCHRQPFWLGRRFFPFHCRARVSRRVQFTVSWYQMIQFFFIFCRLIFYSWKILCGYCLFFKTLSIFDKVHWEQFIKLAWLIRNKMFFFSFFLFLFRFSLHTVRAHCVLWIHLLEPFRCAFR